MKSEDLPAGEGEATQIRRIRMGDGHVMVARLGDGRLVAFAPSCPHQVTPLDDATLRDGIMRCPRHGYQYDAFNGANVFPTRDARPENLWKLKPKYLPVHEVMERDGWIWVAQEPNPPPASWHPELEVRPEGAPDEPAPATGAAATAMAVEPPAAVEQSMRFLNATAGEELEIRVPATPLEGYEWRLDLTGELLEILEDQFEGGEMPCQRVRLAARDVGAATLTCTYRSTFDAHTAAIRTYIIRVAPPA